MWGCGLEGSWEERGRAGSTRRRDHRRGRQLPPSALDIAETIRTLLTITRAGGLLCQALTLQLSGSIGVPGSPGSRKLGTLRTFKAVAIH